jgi:hypothetical protein
VWGVGAGRGLTGKNPECGGPGGIPSWGGIGPKGLGAEGFYITPDNSQSQTMATQGNHSTGPHHTIPHFPTILFPIILFPIKLFPIILFPPYYSHHTIPQYYSPIIILVILFPNVNRDISPYNIYTFFSQYFVDLLRHFPPK